MNQSMWASHYLLDKGMIWLVVSVLRVCKNGYNGMEYSRVSMDILVLREAFLGAFGNMLSIGMIHIKYRAAQHMFIISLAERCTFAFLP